MATLYDRKTKKPANLDGEALQQAIVTGTHTYEKGAMVPGLSPTGEPVNIPVANLNEALQSGYRAVGAGELAIEQHLKDNSGWSGAAEVFAKQAVDELAMGLPELIYQKTGDPMEVAKWEAQKKEHDFANTFGGAVGFGVGLFAGAPLWKAAAKPGEKIAAHIAEKLGAKALSEGGALTAKNVGGRALAKATGAAVEGGILSAPHAITEAALGDPKDAAETLITGIGVGALFGGGGSIAGDLFSAGRAGVRKTMEKIAGEDVDPVRGAARKMAKVFTGVNEDDIIHYADNWERINNAPPPDVEGIKAIIDNKLGNLHGEAQEASDKLQIALADLRDGYKLKLQELSQVRPPEQLVDDILAEQVGLKQRLGEYSDRLYEALGNAEGEVTTAKLKALVTGQIRGLEQPRTGGKVFGEKAKSEHARLSQLRIDLDALPKKMSMTDAKDLIKSIDPDLNWTYGAGEFNELADRHGKAFRKFLNKQIHESSPEVKQILGEMSEVSDALSDLTKVAGTPEKAYKYLKKFNTADADHYDPILSRVSGIIGRDIAEPLRLYKQAKATLDRAKVKNISSVLNKELTANVAAAQEKVNEVIAKIGPVKRLSGRAQNVIRNMGFKTPIIDDERAIEALSKMLLEDGVEALQGTNLAAAIKDRNVLDAFAKDSTNGSRKVNLLSALVGGAAGLVVGGPVASAVGALAGATLDPYGGAILKQLLDSSKDVRGLLAAEKAMKNAAHKLDRVPDILKKMGAKAGGVSPRTMAIDGVQRLLGKNQDKPANREERARNLEALKEKAAALMGDPRRAANELSGLVSPFTEGGAPGIGQEALEGLQRAYEYLFKSMPKAPSLSSPFAPEVEFKPSDQQLSDFEQKAAVINDPFVVLDELESGSLTKNHMEALQAVYPAIHRMIQERVQKAVIEAPTPLPYSQRIKLSLLMGAPMDRSMRNRSVAMFQQNFAPAQDQQGGGGGASMAKSKMAESTQSDVARLMS